MPLASFAHLENVSAQGNVNLTIQTALIHHWAYVVIVFLAMVALIIYLVWFPSVTQIIDGNSLGILNIRGDVQVGVRSEEYRKVVKELGVKKETIDTFLRVILDKKVPAEDQLAKLIEMANRYKEFLVKADALTSDDPEVQSLLRKAKFEVEQAHFDEAEKLYNQASDKDVAATEEIEKEKQRLQEILKRRENLSTNY